MDIISYILSRKYTIEAIETTTSDYDQLSSSEKLDPKKIYFINDTQSSVIETPIDCTTFYGKAENSGCMSVSLSQSSMDWTYQGGSLIGANAFRSIAIPKTATKIKFKLTTGGSYSTGEREDWKICIGVKATYTTNWINPTDNDWLVKKTYDARNSVFEDYLDLSEVNTDSYLMISLHGWTASFEFTIEDVTTPTGKTEIKYKDVSY